MSTNKLFSTYKLGKTELKNRIVMSPMTRSRAISNIPNELIAEYYAQRADAGLIITEGTSPSPNGLGYARMPGIFNEQQIEAWKKVTHAVHSKDGNIFVQLMHAGRIAHELNLPKNAKILAPSAVKAAGQMWTDAKGMQELPEPAALTADELKDVKKEFVQAAKNAIAAGFDGIELHGANGYLIEQFISPFTNLRTDEYGGSIENRGRFVLELAEEISNAIGKEKVGIRFSPYGAASDMKHYDEIDESYSYLAKHLGNIGIAYIHVVDHSSLGAPKVPSQIKHAIREQFGGTIILAGGFDKQKAEADLQHDNADLIAFGRPFINNPDLVFRIKNNLPLSNNLDTSTFYSPGEKGYTDYPVYEEELVTA
jgi:N-ethylmaleimide reductase